MLRTPCTLCLSGPMRQLRAQPLHVTVFRQASRHIAHFRQGTAIDLQGTVVRLPLEGQELLGLRKNETVKDSELNTVYEQLVVAAMEAGYSDNAVNGRLEALDFVRRDIIGSKGRARDNRELDLPTDLLPGALALMTEVGQCQLALDIGSELLRSQDSLPPDVRRDVILSMALANCGLASENLEGRSAQQVGPGCSYLEAALQHLEAAGEPPLAPGLAAEIRQGLGALRFQGAVEQLSAPLSPSKAEARKRAVRVVRDAIRAQSQIASPQPDAPLGLSGLGLAMGGARSVVAGGGAVGAGTVGAGVAASRAAVSGGAAAVAAAAPLTPESMETLMSALTCDEVVHLFEWEQLVGYTAGLKWVYPGLLEAVAVAHVVQGFVCRQPAYIKMGLGQVQQLPSTPDLCVVEGVCHVLLGAINQAAQVLRQAERPTTVKAAASVDRSAAAPPPDVAISGDALPPSRDAYRFVVAASAGSDDGLLPGLCLLTERWLQQAAFPFFRDTSGPNTPPASLVKYFDDTRVETLLTVYDAKSGGQLAETLSEAFSSIKRGLRKAAAARLMGPAGQVDGGDTDSEPALADRQRLFRMVAGGFAMFAAVGVGLLTPPGQRLLGRGDGAQVAVMRQRGVLQPIVVAPEEFNSSVARSLLERWQVAKAWALGAAHTTDQLEVLLAEPLLGETVDKVATLRSHGAHMRFNLIRLEVVSVKRAASKTGPAVRIDVLVEESADLHNDSDGKPVNTCHRVYDAEYTVVQGKDGVWRMTGSNVVEREARQ